MVIWMKQVPRWGSANIRSHSTKCSGLRSVHLCIKHSRHNGYVQHNWNVISVSPFVAISRSEVTYFVKILFQIWPVIQRKLWHSTSYVTGLWHIHILILVHEFPKNLTWNSILPTMLPPLMHRQYKREIYIWRKAGIIHGTTAEIPLALLKKKNEKIVTN